MKRHPRIDLAPVLPYVGGAIVLVMVLITIAFQTINAPKEVDAWKKHVWVLSKKHVSIKPLGLEPAIVRDLEKAISRWNRDLKLLGGPSRFFRLWRKPLPRGLLIRVAPAPIGWQVAGKCELLKTDDRTDLEAGFLAKFDAIADRRADGRQILKGGAIYLCVKKIKHARRLMLSDAAKKLHKDVFFSVLLHELSHVFWWDHPRLNGGRTAKGSLLHNLTKGEKAILQRYVIPQLIEK